MTGESIRLLLVEDSEDQVRMCKNILSGSGEFIIDVAKEGGEALIKIGENNYDAVLLDYMLPDMTGLDILKKVKSEGYKKPIIMVTAEGSEEVAAEALRNGAVDYIIKGRNYYRDLPRYIQKNVEKYRLKQELDASEEKYKTLVETLNEGIIAVDLEGKITFVNRKMTEISGYSENELIGRNAGEFLDKINRKKLAEELKKRSEGESSEYELEIITKKGRKLSASVSASPLYDRDGNVTGSISNLTETTKIKQVNAELQLLQKVNNAINKNIRLDEIFHIIIDGLKADLGYGTSGITMLSPDKKYLELKSVGLEPKIFRTIEKHTGLNVIGHKIPLFEGSMHTELVRKKKPILSYDPISFYEDWTDKKSLKRMAKIVVKVTKPKSLISVPLINEGEVIGTIGVGSKGELTHADLERLESFSKQVGTAVIRAKLEQQLREHAEVLEKKVGERTVELKRSEERYKDLFDNLDDLVYTHDLGGKFMTVNKAVEQLLGYKKIELLSMNVHDIVDIQDSDHILKVMQKVLENGVLYGYELWLRTKEGQKIPFEVNASLIHEDGKAVGIRAILRDISERKRNERELMKKLMKYRIESGRVYLILDRKLRDVEGIMNDALNSGFRGVAISRTNPGEMKERFGDKVKVLWLSETEDGGNILSHDLDILTERIKEFAGPYVIILLDRLDYLIVKNGFSKVLHFIQELNEVFYFEKGVLVLSLDPRTLKSRELVLLENEVDSVELKLGSDLSDELLDVLRYVYKQNRRGEYPSYKEIKDNFNITKGTVRNRVKILKNRHVLVERKKGRFKILELTDEGKALF